MSFDDIVYWGQYRWYTDPSLWWVWANGISVPLFIGFLMAANWPSLETKFSERAHFIMFSIPISIVSIFWAAELAFIVGRFLIDYNLQILNVTHYRAAIPFATMFAVFAYWLRGVRPKVYGIAEMMIGVTTISVAVQADDPGARLLTIASGIYIWVRGMDNFDKGLSGAMKDKWRRAFPRPLEDSL